MFWFWFWVFIAFAAVIGLTVLAAWFVKPEPQDHDKEGQGVAKMAGEHYIDHP